jgi:sugar lactone lactonase YvrE
LIVGGAAGIAAGVAVVVVLVSGGGDPTPSSTSTVAAATATTGADSSTTAPAGAKPAATNGTVIDAIAGNGEDSSSGGEGGPAIKAGLDRPESVAVARNGDVYLTDNDSQRILKVASDGVLTVLYRGSTADGESNTYGVAVAPDGSVWFSNGRGVFKFEGTKATLVLDDELTGAPFSLAFDPAGNLYIAEVGGQRVLKYDTGGVVSPIAGTGEQSPQVGGVGDGGKASVSPLGNPSQIAVDDKGNLYIAETFTRRIRKMTPDGIISTVAGGGKLALADAPDGTAGTDLAFDTVDGVAVDKAGNVYASDHGQEVIVRFGADGKLVHVAGLFGGAAEDDRSPLTTRLLSPSRMVFDGNGDLYFVDGLRVRRIKDVA